MIRVVMFDLGDTLVDSQLKPFPGVPEALAAIAGMRCADGRPVKTCIVSDWKLADPPLPATAKRIKPLVEEFLGLFDQTGLRDLFEPVVRRVTLSTHAGAMKPSRAVFEAALARLRTTATLDECLFITENAAHVKAVRQKLGAQALRFRAGLAGSFDFDTWSQAPALVERALGSANPGNLHAAARVHLAAQGMVLDRLEPGARRGQVIAHGQVWQAVPLPGKRSSKTVNVGVPTRAVLRRGPRGQLEARIEAPGEEAVAEAAGFAASLASQGQIGDRPTASHRLEPGEDGKPRLVRRGFSAF